MSGNLSKARGLTYAAMCLNSRPLGAVTVLRGQLLQSPAEHLRRRPGFPHFQKRRSTIRAIDPIQQDVDKLTRDEFLQFRQKDEPFVLKRSSSFGGQAVPVIAKWFDFRSAHKQLHIYARPYLSDLGNTPVTYEWTLTPSVEHFISSLQPGDLRSSVLRGVAENVTADSPSPFLRFTAPLQLFIAALHYNNSQSCLAERLAGLYIAQSSISGLPSDLQEDLTPPPIISTDSIYNSSIWLGLAPTYTPLHRDPNPNLFRQLHGCKVVRILPPRAGEAVFTRVQSLIGGAASPRLRGQEMMHGPEKTALHDAIWAVKGDPRIGDRTIYEARLGAGDAMYLPKGWWHSIKSAAADAEPGLACDGELNCSVNWWFRSSAGK